MSHPIERSAYIKAFQKQLLQELAEAENRRLRREATADRSRLSWWGVMLRGAVLIPLLIALVAQV